MGSPACRSLRAPEVPSRPVASPAAELTLIRADSELFAAVVRAQTSGKDDEYPYRLDHLRYDPRPYGSPSGYPETFAGVQGIDPTLSFARARQQVIDRITENRKRILGESGVPDGGPVSYSQCAGADVPPPPPPRRGSRSARRSKPRDVHAGCPRTPEYYLTVGLPVRGQPPGLRNTRSSRGRVARLNGEVWTVLVDEHYTGPNGWSWAEYAWLFERHRSGRLELASTVPIAVIK